MMKQAERRIVFILMAVLLLCSAVLSEVILPGHEQYEQAANARTVGDLYDKSGARTGLRGTAFQTLMPTLFGVREVIASLLWVHADDYFHRGEYKPIVSMIHEITAIDPHQLDVYATGAWHLAYNFMDKRMIEDGVHFLEEGCANNDNVYDLYFELGYMHYDKTKDYPASVEAYRKSSERGMTTGSATPPSYVRHQLAHAMEKMGDIDSAVAQWDSNLKVGKELEREGVTAYGPAGANSQAARHNLYITKRRLDERLAMNAEREGNAPEALRQWQEEVKLCEEWLREFPKHEAVTKDLQAATLQVDRLKTGKLNPIKPTDLDLHFTVTRVEPRLLRIEGTTTALELSRVRVQFEDKDYQGIRARGFNYRMDNGTLEFDNPSIRGGKFHYDLKLNKDPADMDRDPAEIYPLKSSEYLLKVIYDPRQQAAFIQDRYGWNGEGLTAKGDMLREDPTRAGIMGGKKFPLRWVEKDLVIKREDIFGKDKKVIAKV